MISWRQFTQLHYFGNRLLHLAHLARLDKGLSQTKKHKRDLLGEKKHKNTKANQKLCSYAKKERVTCGLDRPSYLLPVASVAAGASSRRIGSFGTYEAMLIDVKDERRTSLLHPDTVPTKYRVWAATKATTFQPCCRTVSSYRYTARMQRCQDDTMTAIRGASTSTLVMIQCRTLCGSGTYSSSSSCPMLAALCTYSIRHPDCRVGRWRRRVVAPLRPCHVSIHQRSCRSY